MSALPSAISPELPIAWRAFNLPGFKGFRIVLAVILSAIALIGLFAYAYPTVAQTPMAIYAHRGDLDDWPEDTLESIRGAAQIDVDGMEFDIQRSADGTWWLSHHPDLTRATTGSGLIGETPDRVLETLTIDGGLGFDPDRHVGLRMARLDGVLEVLAGYRGQLIFDAKETTEGHAELARLLVERGLTGAYVICRTHPAAAAVKAVDERLTTIMLTDPSGDPNVDIWLVDGLTGIGFPWTTIADFRGRVGMVAIDPPWELDERPMLDKGRRWGIEFVITNHPAVALDWRTQLTQP
jgi:glycerophosphoryl diester phosphodiesterase